MRWWKDFKEFAIKGNLVSIAVGLIMALAFTAVVTSLIENVVSPLIGAIVGEPDFSGLTISVGDGVILYGSFITAVVNFLLVASVLFLIVKAYERATRPRDVAPDAPTVRACPFCVTDISVKATRCPSCTSEIRAA